MEDSYIKSESLKASLSFTSSNLYHECNSVFLYMAMKNEADPVGILQKSRCDDKEIFIPKVTDKTSLMDFYLMDNSKNIESQLSVGMWKIKEPDISLLKKLDVSSLSCKNICMIVPGLAFSRTGVRLGRGRGFYDRYISEIKKYCNPTLIGFCLEEQCIDNIPCESHDITMDYILTPKSFFRVS